MGRRQKNAREGLEKLRKHTHTLIAIPNDRLLYVAPRNLAMETAFRLADDVLRQSVQGITEIITQPGMINVDFAHVRRLLGMGGGALMAIGHGMTLGEDLGYYEASDMPHTPMAVGARISSVLAFALSDEVLAGMTPTGSAFHVWHDQIEAPPPSFPATATTTASFGTRYADPFVLTGRTRW